MNILIILIVLLWAVIALAYGLWALLTRKKMGEGKEQKIIPYSERKLQTLESSKSFTNDDNGITELIRQQEQTNKHLQKLISDFFWFRIGIIVLLIFGGIQFTGGFN